MQPTPTLLARVRWANLARLAILAAAVLLIAGGPGSCQSEPQAPTAVPPAAFHAPPPAVTTPVPEPKLGAKRRLRAHPSIRPKRGHSRRPKPARRKPKAVERETRRAAPPVAEPAPYAPPPAPAPVAPPAGEFTPDP